MFLTSTLIIALLSGLGRWSLHFDAHFCLTVFFFFLIFKFLIYILFKWGGRALHQSMNLLYDLHFMIFT